MNTDAMINAQAAYDMRMPPKHELTPVEEAIAEVCRDHRFDQMTNDMAEFTLTLCRDEKVGVEIHTAIDGQPTELATGILLASRLQELAKRILEAVR